MCLAASRYVYAQCAATRIAKYYGIWRHYNPETQQYDNRCHETTDYHETQRIYNPTPISIPEKGTIPISITAKSEQNRITSTIRVVSPKGRVYEVVSYLTDQKCPCICERAREPAKLINPSNPKDIFNPVKLYRKLFGSMAYNIKDVNLKGINLKDIRVEP